MVQTIPEICLSETLARETESVCERSFTPSNVDSRRKGSSGHFLHKQHGGSWKCRRWRGGWKNIPNRFTSEELTGEIDEAKIKGRKVGIGTISNKIVGYWYQIKLQERIQNYHPVQVTSLNAPENMSKWILISRGWWVSVHNKCARRKRTTIICTSNLPSLPWTSRVWFTRFEQRWNEGQIFRCASGNRCLHKSGKILASSKAAASAAATAATILHRLHPRKRSIYRKKDI